MLLSDACGNLFCYLFLFQTSDSWKALARIAALCNRAEFKADQDHIPILKRYMFMEKPPSWAILCNLVVSAEIASKLRM